MIHDKFRKVICSTLGLICMVSAQVVVAQSPLKIGFVSTFSGPVGQLGEELHAGFNLALEHLGGDLGGVPVENIVGDDQAKPDVARQVVDKMIEQDKVDVLTGMLNSSVLLSIIRPAMDANKIVISSVAAPSILAGKQCNQNFFVASPQNDSPSEAVGSYLKSQGVKTVALIASNYPAGRDKMAGFKRFFDGEVVVELYPPFTQLDYSAEIAQIRDAKPDAVFQFLPGAVGINFLKQFTGAGLNESIDLYADLGGLDETMINAAGEAAVGAKTASFWVSPMDNPVNQKFVEAYEEKYNRLPSFYAANGYDTALLLDKAIQVAGGAKDKLALRNAMSNVKFDAVRGDFEFNSNHIPLTDFYLTTVEKDEAGRYVLAQGEKILTKHKDAYASECTLVSN